MFKWSPSIGIVLSLAVGGGLHAGEAEPLDGVLVQIGTMHQAIGQQQHQGRVALSHLVKRPHFFAVGALEQLKGEVTIDDGRITITGVDPQGAVKLVEEANNQQATMLVGAYNSSWQRHVVSKDVTPANFDDFIATTAAMAGVDTETPFVFRFEGEFTDVHLHVINGACPLHARMRKIELPPAKQPYESNLPMINGRLIGVFARDAVGKLTHPDTSTHVHILFEDDTTGQQMTGHVEQVGLPAGAVLMLPE